LALWHGEICHQLHRRHEHIAETFARADHGLTRAGIAERASQIVDDPAQRAFSDVRVWPELLAQLRDAGQLARTRN
jgi:hypothetical protein